MLNFTERVLELCYDLVVTTILSLLGIKLNKILYLDIRITIMLIACAVIKFPQHYLIVRFLVVSATGYLRSRIFTFQPKNIRDNIIVLTSLIFVSVLYIKNMNTIFLPPFK